MCHTSVAQGQCPPDWQQVEKGGRVGEGKSCFLSTHHSMRRSWHGRIPKYKVVSYASLTVISRRKELGLTREGKGGSQRSTSAGALFLSMWGWPEGRKVFKEENLLVTVLITFRAFPHEQTALPNMGRNFWKRILMRTCNVRDGHLVTERKMRPWCALPWECWPSELQRSVPAESHAKSSSKKPYSSLVCLLSCRKMMVK